jgi:uncharacterized protein (DUF2147 family)
MMARILACLLLSCAVLFSAEDISGFWKTLSDDTGKPQSVIAVYEYEGLYYGRIIGSFDEDGKMDDSIEHPVKRAPGVVGNPFYSGLDIIWWLADSGSKFKGKILDPEHGDIYKSELWMDGSNLVVRGKLFIFGRSMTWYPATASDFPKGFKMPDLKTLVPTISEVN